MDSHFRFAMSEGQPNSKKPSKKHKPPGLKILHEDRDIIVVDKSEGLLTISNDKVKDKTAHYFLNNYVQKGNPKSRERIFIVHRLDRDTSGVLVFARNENAKAYLQEEWGQFKKKYYAVVLGKPPETEGEITSYLMENAMHRMYSVQDPNKGKFAKTGYKVLKTAGGSVYWKLNYLLVGKTKSVYTWPILVALFLATKYMAKIQKPKGV